MCFLSPAQHLDPMKEKINGSDYITIGTILQQSLSSDQQQAGRNYLNMYPQELTFFICKEQLQVHRKVTFPFSNELEK